jgi:hypothetical protein
MTPDPRSESGTALLAAILVTSLLTTIAAVLTFITVAGTLASANYRAAQETAYAAEAGLERAMTDVRALADWSLLVSGAALSAFDDGAAAPVAPDGRPLDLAALTARVQAASDADSGGPVASPDAPSWHLFAHGHVSRLLPPGAVTTPAYVVVWIADDADDRDGDAGRDSNGAVMLMAQAFGARGAQRAVQATVARTSSGVRLTSWRADP